MAILLKKFKVRSNGRTYVPGETISGLSTEDEARLVSDGMAEYVGELTEAPNEINASHTDNQEEETPDEDNQEEETLTDETTITETPQEIDTTAADTTSTELSNITLDADEYVEAANVTPEKPSKKKSGK